MKRNSTLISLSLGARRANIPQTIVALVTLSLVTGMLTDTADEMLAYMLVTIVCAVPCVLWISAGTPGVPLLPPICIMSLVYYALPVVRKNAHIADFESSEILSGAITVALFIVAATTSWWLLLVRNVPERRIDAREVFSERRLIQVIFVGLASGIVFYVATYSGWVEWLGPSFGLFRSVMITVTTAACFLLGYARARGSLRGRNWAIAVGSLSLIILLSWISLFLVFGLIMCLAAVLGYVITSKRVPWRFLSAVLPVIIILHAGKGDMRDKYWSPNTNFSAQLSVFDMPALIAEWVGDGLVEIREGSTESAIDRASLLHVLLQVQRMTPSYVPFFDGESYALLPQMLVPRFLDPDKIASQAAMDLLNIRYGFLTAEETKKTAAGWGLVAEAYANFGRFGVIGVGFLLGLFCGLIERWSFGAAIISLPTFVAVITMLQLINLEADAASLLTTLFQSIVSVSSIFWLMQALAKHKKRLPQGA